MQNWAGSQLAVLTVYGGCHQQQEVHDSGRMLHGLGVCFIRILITSEGKCCTASCAYESAPDNSRAVCIPSYCAGHLSYTDEGPQMWQ